MIRAAIFDLDGTLVDSLPGIAHALNGALDSHHQSEHPESRVRDFIGNGTWVLARRALPDNSPDELIAAVEAAFVSEYSTSWKTGTSPYPRTEELVATLKARGLPLAVFSNKPDAFTKEIVAHLFPDGAFQAVLGHRDGEPRKPAPDGAFEIAAGFGVHPTEVAFVGDSMVDLETARNASMVPILVDWGYHSGVDLAAAGVPLVSSPEELLPLLPRPRRGT